ncbi:hypothetical protein [Steroidobacter cummioxidans]|uniref:hypothetical protein n=1 Tax=Steroidobacter cummioxidans TaxID=1803913 RepID=UPI000E30E8BF|nr:hypothetical protein [Steroidobacter cummioxidans]
MVRSLENLAQFLKDNRRPFMLVALVPAVIGIGTDRLIGGPVAQFAGRLQFIGLISYFWCAFTMLLFMSYSQRVDSILRSPAIESLRVLIFVLYSALALFSIVFTLVVELPRSS